MAAKQHRTLPTGRRPGPYLVLGLLLVVLIGLDLSIGSTGFWSPRATLSGLGGVLGIGPGLDTQQVVFELRLARVGTAVGVGAALAYAGVLLQGIFRNDLAAPGVGRTGSRSSRSGVR